MSKFNVSFPKFSRQFLIDFPKIIDTRPKIVDTFLKTLTIILNWLTLPVDSLSICIVEAVTGGNYAAKGENEREETVSVSFLEKCQKGA